MNKTQAQLTNVEQIRQYLTGGHALFTLVSKKTGDRITFKISTADHGFFVGQLTGPDNQSDYTYIGFLTKRQHILNYKPKNIQTKASAALVWFMSHLNTDSINADQVEFWHAGVCARCGRVLTNPESIEIGIGPKCLEKEGF